jgi:hypothetical protein
MERSRLPDVGFPRHSPRLAISNSTSGGHQNRGIGEIEASQSRIVQQNYQDRNGFPFLERE